MSEPARRRLTADARRAEILDAARALFAERGYDATTTRDIARAAGTSDALLYRHFAGKQDVLEQVIDRTLALFGTLPPLERLRWMSDEELLTTIGQGFLDRLQANLDLLVVLVGTRSRHSDTRFAAFVDRAATALGDELVRRISSLSPDEAYLSARTYFGALVAFVLLQNTLGMNEVRPVEPRSYLEHLVHSTVIALAGDATE